MAYALTVAYSPKFFLVNSFNLHGSPKFSLCTVLVTNKLDALLQSYGHLNIKNPSL